MIKRFTNHEDLVEAYFFPKKKQKVRQIKIPRKMKTF